MKVALVVDDSTFARMNMRKTLVGCGFEVLEAGSGSEALKIASQTPPDLITLDLLMPEMSGQEVLVELRKFLPASRVLIVTADVQKLTHQELLATGADGILNKPVAKSELMARLASWFEISPNDNQSSETR